MSAQTHPAQTHPAQTHPAQTRPSRRWRLGLSLLASAALVAPTASSVAAPSGPAHRPAPAAAAKTAPGPAGPTIVVEQQAQYSGYDLATDPVSGTSYLGWISSSTASGGLRDVHLCVLPAGATGCAGGVLTNVLGSSSASGLQVEVTGPGVAELVWFDQNAGGGLVSATYVNGVLWAPTPGGAAPSFGQLLDVVTGPGGLWAVTSNATGDQLQVRQGLNGVPIDIAAPWMVGNAQLAFAGAQPQLLIARYGAVSEPVQYATGVPWSGFQPIPKTWNVGIFNDIVGTARGVRVITSEANADYRPVVSKGKGSSFGKPSLIGDSESCPPYALDLVTDASRRVAGVVQHCDQLSIYNLADTKRAGIVRMPTGGTSAGGPQQITTTARGMGWVAWGILSEPAGSGNTLLVREIRLPAEMTDKADRARGGKVTVIAPVSCLPVSSAKAKVKAKAAKGWGVASRSLKLDGKNEGRSVSIDGSKLAAGSKHTLVGTAVFKKGGQRSTATKRYSFRAC